MHFQNSNFVKIGITTSIVYRIKQVEKHFNLSIDHHKTLVVTGQSRGRIKMLENWLLESTLDFQHEIKPVSKGNFGQNEFRTNNCLKLIKQYILDQRDYGINYKIYRGVDVCGHYTITIPKVYYHVELPVSYISNVLYEDIQKYCANNKISPLHFYNDLLYQKMVELGIDRKDLSPGKYEDYFKA